MAVEIGAILDLMRSGADASEKFIAGFARALALRAELINEAVKNNEPVTFWTIEQKVAAIKKETPEVEKTTAEKVKEKVSILEAGAALGLLFRGAVELVELASRPNPASAAMLAVMPPPLVIGLYAVVTAVNLVKSGFEVASIVSQQSKIMFGNLNEDEKKDAVQQRNKALMNLATSALAIAASCTMIAAAFFAPGSTNLLGVSFLGASLALSTSRIFYGSAKGASETAKEISQKEGNDNTNSNTVSQSHQHTNQNTAQHEEKKERTENLGKALGAYFTALVVATFRPAPTPPTTQTDPFVHHVSTIAPEKAQQEQSELATKNTAIVEPKTSVAPNVAAQSPVARVVAQTTVAAEDKVKLK